LRESIRIISVSIDEPLTSVSGVIAGVAGYAPAGMGVYGEASNGWGVRGSTDTGVAVVASSSSNGFALAVNGGPIFIIQGTLTIEPEYFPSPFGGEILWSNFIVQGAASINALDANFISSSIKHFKVDHPRDPAHKYLYHASVV
jgi:hypothetical protein